MYSGRVTEQRKEIVGVLRSFQVRNGKEWRGEVLLEGNEVVEKIVEQGRRQIGAAMVSPESLFTGGVG